MKSTEELLVTGEIYHVYNKSIAEFKIFNSNSDFWRITEALRYYKIENNPLSFCRINKVRKEENISAGREKIVSIIAYCIMPTHIHLILKQVKDKGISVFMNNILNSYSRYFNLKHKRKGPLWEGRFKRIRVEDEGQLLHLTRYIHLNPVTAHLVNNPIEWEASSYMEYLSLIPLNNRICEYGNILEINTDSYKKFVEDRISYQRELEKIKKIIFD